MPKQIVLRHAKKQRSVTEFIKSLPADQERSAKQLLELFKDATGARPRMWGDTMIGFGEYDYKRSNGDYGSYFATGFAIRKSGPTIYIMPGYNDYSDLLQNIGPYKLGKSCLYLKSLENIDLTVLSQLIKAGVKDLKKTHTVKI
jgi:hypothetical protein